MILRRDAEFDIADARAWYERQQEGLGDEFLEAVEAAFQRIVDQPESCQIVYEDYRRATTRRFPFVIYYRLIAGEIVVVAVLHGHRDPRIWKSRS